MLGSLSSALPADEETYFYTTWDYAFTRQNLVYGAIIFGVFVIIGVALTIRSSLFNDVISIDSRGLRFMRDETGGGSRWMEKKDISDVFYVGNVKNTTGTIYGQLTDRGGEKVVAWKKKKRGASGNQNDIIIASMGSGKTFTYVYNELIQTVLRGDSFIVMDPKGECFLYLAKFCKERGVDVHVLNMVTPKYSEFWNCLEETIDPKTERVDGTRLNEFVDIYMQNTYDAGASKDFWYNSALNLIKAVIGYLAYEREMTIINEYIRIYKKVSNWNVDERKINRMENSLCAFPWCREVILKAAEENGYDTDYVKKLLEDVEKYKPNKPYNLSSVVDFLINFSENMDSMKVLEKAMWHPGYIPYMTYMTNDSETVRSSALQGAQLRFALLSDGDLKDVLSYPGIHIGEINKRQSAFFVRMSDKANTTKPFVSLFTSFLFKDAMETFDENEQAAVNEGKKNNTLGITVMLEEFFSIGVIGGSPEVFGMYMSTARSRKLYVKVIIQYYTQLEALYGPNIKHAIQGGCSTLLYLGANDPETCKFISYFGGEATIMSESHQETANRILPSGITQNVANVSTKSRPLITEDDARRWKGKTLVIKQGEYPLPIIPFPWIDHWVCKEGLIKLDKDGNVMAESTWSLEKFVSPVFTRVEEIENSRNEAIAQLGDLSKRIENIPMRKEEVVSDEEIGDFFEDDEEIPDDIFEDDEDVTEEIPNMEELFEDSQDEFEPETEQNPIPDNPELDKKDDSAQKKKEQEEAERAREEAIRKAAEAKEKAEAEAKRKEEAEARKKAEMEAEAKRKAEAESKRKAEAEKKEQERKKEEKSQEHGKQNSKEQRAQEADKLAETVIGEIPSHGGKRKRSTRRKNKAENEETALD